jgi:hypothetical protein
MPTQRYVVTLPDANPAGRRKVSLEYRPLRTWTEQRLAAVRELLVEYFRRIGGFRRAGNATVRAWYDATGGTFTADELSQAVAAKARSLAGVTPEDTRDRRRFVAHPQRFLRVAGYWLSQSPEYQARMDELRAADGQRLRLSLAEVGLGGRFGPEGLASGGAGGSAPAAAERAAQARREAFWAGLSTAQRLTALSATRPAFVGRCEPWGASPDAPALKVVWEGMAIEWAGRKWPACDIFGGSSTAGKR